MIQASAAFLTANAALIKTPIFLIEIAGYSRAFTNLYTGVTGQYDWLESIDDQQITVHDLDGGADLGALTFHVQDRGGAITADFPTFTFEGKTVTLKTGFFGMSTSDYALLFTGKIDSVASDNANVDYLFTCVDNKDILSKVVYTVGDDGSPIGSKHTRTINGHPLDILSALLTNELGLSTSQFNANKLLIYRNGFFAGVQFLFTLDAAPAAKDFIENQIMKPLGGYIWVNSKGLIDFNFFRRDNRQPITGACCLAAWTDSSGVIIGAPFLVNATTGQDMTVVAPPGATLLSMGVNDNYYTDNIGGWSMYVNGVLVTVTSTAAPWSAAINPTYNWSGYPGTSAPLTTPVVAGTTYTIHYGGGTINIGPGWPFNDPLGIAGTDGTTIHHAGQYAISIAGPLTTPNLAFDDTNLDDQNVPLAEQADLINTITFRFDKTTSGGGGSSGGFLSESDLTYTTSVSKYGQYGQQIIEADGVRAGFQGYFVAAQTANMIFARYGMKNLQFENVQGFWSCCLLEPGDLVTLTSAFVPDRVLGVMGITNKLFEVLDRTLSFETGLITVKLLDASYLQIIGDFLISPNGIPVFASGTPYQQGRYLYLANDSDQYSTGVAANTLG